MNKLFRNSRKRMRYKPKEYAESLMDSLAEADAGNKEEILKRFVKLLRKTGDVVYWRQISEAISDEETKRKGGAPISIESARELDESRKAVISAFFSKEDRLKFKPNPDLVAGIRITVGGSNVLDSSFEKKLRGLFS